MSGGPSLQRCLDVVIQFLRERQRLIDIAIAGLERVQQDHERKKLRRIER